MLNERRLQAWLSSRRRSDWQGKTTDFRLRPNYVVNIGRRHFARRSATSLFCLYAVRKKDREAIVEIFQSWEAKRVVQDAGMPLGEGLFMD